MPFVSEAQRRYLWATNPDVAREFADKTPKGEKLPERLRKEKRDRCESPHTSKTR